MSTYLTDDELKRSKELLDRIQKIFAQRVVGQEQLRETLIVGLLAQGHIAHLEPSTKRDDDRVGPRPRPYRAPGRN